MKKINIKKMGLPIALVIVIVLSSVVAVWTMNQTDAKKLKDNNETSTTESTTLADGEEPATEVYTEIVEVVETSKKDNGEIVTVKTTEIETKVKVVNATEKKEDKTTKEAKGEKASEAKTEAQTTVKVQNNAPVVATTNKVVPTTQASKPVVTTKPVATTKPVETTKKPTTTKASKDEYYPALTASDMEYLKQYAADYIKSKGYTHNPDLDWDNCGYSSTVGMNDNLANYGNKYKINGGISPVEWAKRDIKSRIDGTIEEFGDVEWLEMTLLVERNEKSWGWAIGYMA